MRSTRSGCAALALAGDHDAAPGGSSQAGRRAGRSEVDEAYAAARRRARRGPVVGLRRGLRDRELRGPAGDVPERARGGRRAAAHRRLLGLVLQRARPLLPGAQEGSLDDLRMAVVVQQMVEPRKSGVLFTVDPVQRRRDRMVVEAVFGLGEQVVSGHVTPDHYVVDRAGGAKRERLVERRRARARRSSSQLAELGCALEERFGGPQDVEWAIAGGEVYLLQSRPVTTL